MHSYRYTVYFISCEYGKNLAISFDATIELFNLNANGDRDYLSVGETPLETVYWVSSKQWQQQQVGGSCSK
jgi:hypothetical protein